MLGISNIDDFLARIRFHDMRYSVVNKDTFGDLISVFDPDCDYTRVSNAINSSRPVREKVVDSGRLYQEIHDTVFVDGNAVKVSILCEQGDNGFGTSIKMMVKHVDVSIGGEIKSFLSFESLKSYMSRVAK